MSLGQFLMAGGWLLAGNLKERTRVTISHPLFILPAILYAIQLAGLWNTQDTGWGLHDLRIKLPILLLPFLLVAGPGIERRFKEFCLYAIFAGVLLVSFISLFRVLTGDVLVHDFRSMSPFISHIRLSLLLVFSIAAILLLMSRNTASRDRIILTVLAVWFLTYLVVLQSITGLIILAILVLAGAAYGAFQSEKTMVRIPLLLLLLVGLSMGGMLIRYITVDSLEPGKPEPEKLKAESALGSPYRHDIDQIEMENGRFVWIEYNEQELDSAWKLRSKIPLLKSDSAGRFSLATLMRYLTFLGYSKDFQGVCSLSENQIREIEQGYATPLHARTITGLWLRIRELAREYRIYHYTRFAQGHTFAQRLEFQRAAIDIISHHPWTGVGTGDLPQAYAEAYVRINTSLNPEWRLRAHNQYLSIAVANGLGAMGFMGFMLFFLLIRGLRKRNLLHTVFLIIAACSFLTEDTLETQAGVTFFAFLCSITENLFPGDSRPGNKV